MSEEIEQDTNLVMAGGVEVIEVKPVEHDVAAGVSDEMPQEKQKRGRKPKEAVADSGPAPIPSHYVAVRITKHGDGKVHKGEISMGDQACYARGETVHLPPEIAQELEDRLFVEIED